MCSYSRRPSRHTGWAKKSDNSTNLLHCTRGITFLAHPVDNLCRNRMNVFSSQQKQFSVADKGPKTIPDDWPWTAKVLWPNILVLGLHYERYHASSATSLTSDNPARKQDSNLSRVLCYRIEYPFSVDSSTTSSVH